MSPREESGTNAAESSPNVRRRMSSRSKQTLAVNIASVEETTTRTNRLARLAMCATGICVCYLYYGVLQERLFTGKERPGATFVLVTQCITNSIVACLWRAISTNMTSSTASSNKDQSLPLNTRLLILTAGCYVVAMAASNEAIQYVSYPVAVLAKSCKLVPVMLVGQLVEGKLYSKEEWMAALSISIGIVVFHFSRMQVKASLLHTDDEDQSTYGMLLLLASLVMDGLLTCCQNSLRLPSSVLHKYRKPSATDTMFFVNLYALLFLIPLCVLNQQWQHGIRMLTQIENNMATSILVLNLTVAMGQIFIFLSLTWFSSITTTTITTTRKFFTILVSVLSFGHSFTVTQWAAVVLVFVGLYISIGVHATGTVKAKTD